MKTEKELIEIANKIGRVLFTKDLNPCDVAVILGLLQHDHSYMMDKRKDSIMKSQKDKGHKVEIK